MRKLKKRLAILGIFIMILSYNLSNQEFHGHYEILDQKDDAFAVCSNGYVYIGNKAFLKSIYPRENCIFVEDQRCGDDPNMKVYFSSDINSAEEREEILQILQEYESRYPSEWNRTTESMRLEWLMHNLSYQLHYEKVRTGDVDLNNGDEEYYRHKVLQKMFHTN